MCKHSSSGCPALFQPAPTPTRTQKWTPIIFSSLLPAGPDTPRAEPGAAPADTAPGLDAADSPEQMPPAPLQPHPRGSWQGDAAPRLPTSRWQTDTRPSSCSGLAPVPKPARRGLEQEVKRLRGLCHEAPPAPFWNGEADKGTSNQTWDSPRHPNSVTGKPGVQGLPAWPERVQADAFTPVQAQGWRRSPCPVPSRALLSVHVPLPAHVSSRCSYDSPRLPSPGNSQQHFSIILSSVL